MPLPEAAMVSSYHLFVKIRLAGAGVVSAKAGTHNHRAWLLKSRCLPVVLQYDRRGVWVPAFAGTTREGHSRLILNSKERSPPTSVILRAAPSGLVPGGMPSSSKAKRLTPGGLCSSNFGTGSAQSGVGPSTNRLTVRASGESTSTSTVDLPSRLTLRMVSGLGSPTLAGLGTVSSAANSALSSVLATLVKVSSAFASTGMQIFSHTA